MPKSKHRRPSHRRKANRPVATLPQSSVRPYTPQEGESTAHPCSPETKQEISVHSVSSVAKSPSASANSTVNASAPSVFNPNPTIVEADSPECQEMSGNVSDFHTPDTRDLTPRQLAALPIIVASSSNVQGARNAGIAERTFYRWLDNPDFRAELSRLREEAADLVLSDLKSSMSLSLAALIRCTQEDNAFVRYCAARYLFNNALEVGELQHLRDQVLELQSSREISRVDK